MHLDVDGSPPRPPPPCCWKCASEDPVWDGALLPDGLPLRWHGASPPPRAVFPVAPETVYILPPRETDGVFLTAQNFISQDQSFIRLFGTPPAGGGLPRDYDFFFLNPSNLTL